MNPYAAVVRLLGRSRAFACVGSRVMPALDRPFARCARSPTSLGTGFPLCYLTVNGRHSGLPRTVPLLHVADGDRVVLIASNWGRARHPAWALNLDAAGGAEITVAGRARRMCVHRATAEERDRYWGEAVALWPGYEGYRRRARREIRVYVLDPLRRGAAAVPGGRTGPA